MVQRINAAAYQPLVAIANNVKLLVFVASV
jgi:hypothetical protein